MKARQCMNDESDKCQCSMGVLPVSAVEGRAGCAVAMLPLATADPPLVNEHISTTKQTALHNLSPLSLEAGAPLPVPSLADASLAIVAFSIATLLISFPSVALLAPTVI